MSAAHSKNYQSDVVVRSFSPGVLARQVFAQGELFDDDLAEPIETDIGTDEVLTPESFRHETDADFFDEPRPVLSAADLSLIGNDMDKATIEELFLDGTLPAPVWGMEPAALVAAPVEPEADIDPGLAKLRRTKRLDDVAASQHRQKVRDIRLARSRKLKQELRAHPELKNGGRHLRTVRKIYEDRGHQASL